MNSVIIRQSLVFLGFFRQFTFFSTYVIKVIVKMMTGIDAVFFQQVMQVAFGIIVGSRQVFCKKNLYR